MAYAPIISLSLARDTGSDVINEVSALTGAIYYVIGTPGVDEGVTPTITQGTNITSVTGPESDGTVWEGIVVVSDISNFSFTVHCDKYRVYTVDNTSISNWSDAGVGTGVDKVALLEISMIATPEDLFGYSEGSSSGTFYAWEDSGSGTYYTESATPSTGDVVFDDTFEPSGMEVTAINQNNTIEMGVPLMPIMDTSTIASYTIDGVSYSTSQTVVVDPRVSHTFTVTPHLGTNNQLVMNNTLIATRSSNDPFACTFAISGYNITFTGNTTPFTTSTGGFLSFYADSDSCCIAYNTPVNYYDGTTKNAEDVKVGDKLLGYDENAQVFVEVEVLNVIERIKHEMVHIVTTNHFIDITVDHPILTDRGWAVYNSHCNSYKDLNKIDLTYDLKILTSDGIYEDILSIDHYYTAIDEPLRTYTFNVTDSVDTYVAASLISHNAPEPCSGGSN